MKTAKNILISAVLILTSAAASRAAEFAIDPAHSEVTFKVRHMMVSKVQGKFDKFTGDFNYDPKNPSAWKGSAVIDAASINTGNADRDKHLRNADFLDIEKYPQITFRTTKVVEAKENSAKVEGLLKIHGVEKLVVLDVELAGLVKDPWGNTRTGFEAKTRINRKDFGIHWNKTMDNGGMVVSDEVDITLNVEGIEKKPAEGMKAPEKKMEKQIKMEKEPVKK